MIPYIFIFYHPEPRRWFSVKQALEYLPNNIGKTTLYELVAEGRIGFSRPDRPDGKPGRLCFKQQWLDDYLEQNYQLSGEEIAQRILHGGRIPARKKRS